MVLKTYEHDYPITSVMESNDIFDLYICRNVSGGGLCRIMCVKDKRFFPEIVGWLSEKVNFGAFSDFIEHFIYDDMLCIAVKFTQGITLNTRLTTEYLSFGERLELGRKILEKTVIMEIPDYFISKCMMPDNIIVEKDLTVYFNYPIEDIIYNSSRNSGVTEKANANIDNILRTIFAKEIEKNIPKELIKFFDELPVNLQSSRIELYSEYHEMKSGLENQDPDQQEPKTFWYTLWEKIKKVFNKLKTFLTIGLVLAAYTPK